MINLIAPTNIHHTHFLKCKRNIGTFEKGKEYKVVINNCLGRVYEPGYKTIDGRKVWNDKVGKPDTRLMVSEAKFKDGAYCCQSLDALNEAFEEHEA